MFGCSGAVQKTWQDQQPNGVIQDWEMHSLGRSGEFISSQEAMITWCKPGSKGITKGKVPALGHCNTRSDYFQVFAMR
jgi:hypothetical protein